MARPIERTEPIVGEDAEELLRSLENVADPEEQKRRMDVALEFQRQVMQPKTLETKPPVQYVLVRKDLPIFRQMVDVGHATAEALRTAPIDKRTVLRLLHVTDERELLAYHDRLLAKGFHVGLVREPDAPHNGAAMALATEPLTERVNALGKIFFHLRAAKEAANTDHQVPGPELPAHCSSERKLAASPGRVSESENP